MIQSCGSGGCGLLLNDSLDDITTFQPIKYQGKIKQLILCPFRGYIIDEENNLLHFGELEYQKCQPIIEMIPQQIDFKLKVEQICVGNNHTLILAQNNQLFGIGDNNFGQIAQEKKTFYKNPQQIQINQNIIQIFAGFRQSYLKIENNNLLCFGFNKNNELFSDEKGIFFKPKLIEKFQSQNIQDIQTGHKCVFILINNTLRYFGNNEHFMVKEIENVQKFSVGWNHILFLQNQNLYAQGRNNFGQLGQGNFDEIKQVVKINLDKIIDFKAGPEYSFCDTENGLYSFGWNEHGNLALNNNQNQNIYQKINQISQNCQIIIGGASIIIRQQIHQSSGSNTIIL